ncbi:hypothetical protein Wcon_00481 [Wolbachia endosymbiont of Cylisticus convexus]|uniref:hypothetical protein n=1 Tax=Wolbachia endosymbiont of Cylisticus convexus TaxID=118728 RepID=UPI000DF70197|nr:hypothetical protein [Wolbachia endosymbiont of Cylisticus convexus]RDD35360.1 hypothetical protein Wcon_00481 [Wolbachia endosymbiont of Cylisticus convexus]
MYTQNTQQYHEFIRGFFTLFDEIKKEDNPIYNSRVGFNAVKFLIKHSTWNLDEDEDKNEACKVILQEHNKIKEDRQGLQRKAKEILNEYIYGDVNDGVKEISIYGDHASIELKDNKKEFKISEFLNSDFCQKNGISGFSTLHSDGKSGMHGFVAEEGGKKIRHYVVTDGSYEMTLNWHDKNGKKCTIKIKIDKDGVDLTERNGITAEELKANKDVKIGGLFLYQIQFREKGQGREQENQQSSETFIESNSKNIGVQTHRTLSHNQDNRQEDERYDNPTFATFGHAVPGSRKPDGKESLENFQSPLAEKNSQNKRTPPPLRTSSLPNDQQKGDYQQTILSGGNGYRFPSSDPSKSTIFTKSVIHNQDNRQEDERYDNPTFATFGHAVPGSRKPDRSEQTPNNQQQPKTPQQEDGQLLSTTALNNKSDSGYSSPTHANHGQSKVDPEDLTQKLEEEKLNHQKEDKSSQKHGQNSENHDSETHKTSNESIDEKLKSAQPTNPADQVMGELKEVLEKSNRGLTEPEQQVTKENISKDSFSENVLEKIGEGKQYDTIRKWLKDKIEGKEDNQNLDSLEGKLSKKYGQGNIVEKRENDGGKPLSSVNTDGSKESLIDVEQGSDTRSQKSSRRSGQESEEGINEDVKETSFNTPEKIQSELQKDDLADVKTVAAFKSRNDEFKETLNRELEAEEKIEVSSNKVRNEPVGQPIDPAGQVMNELREALGKPGKGLKRPARQIASTLVTNSKNPFLGQIKHDKPIHQWLEKTLAERENADKNSHHR